MNVNKSVIAKTSQYFKSREIISKAEAAELTANTFFLPI